MLCICKCMFYLSMLCSSSSEVVDGPAIGCIGLKFTLCLNMNFTWFPYAFQMSRPPPRVVSSARRAQLERNG